MDESITADDKKQKHQKPPLGLSRIAGEFFAGIGMSFAVMMLALCIEGIVFFGRIGSDGTRTSFMAMFSKVTPGVYGIASAIGVYLLGNKGNQTGSLLLTFCRSSQACRVPSRKTTSGYADSNTIILIRTSRISRTVNRRDDWFQPDSQVQGATFVLNGSEKCALLERKEKSYG